MTFVDPFAAHHPLLTLADAMEKATDDYVAALDADAERENEYLRAHAIQYAKAAAQNIAATVRSKWADAQPEVVEARCAWNLAAARAKACRAKVGELEARLGATQSYVRVIERQS